MTTTAPGSTHGVWSSLFEALGRGDALGYLRARCVTPTGPHQLFDMLTQERRLLLAELATQPPNPERQALEQEIETFYSTVMAEACRWSRNEGEPTVWPWSDGPQSMAPPAVAPGALALLQDSNRGIMAELDLRKLLPLLVERAGALTHADSVVLALWNVELGGLEVIESRGLPSIATPTLAVSREALERQLETDAARYLTRAETPWLAGLFGGLANWNSGIALVAPFRHGANLMGLIVCVGPEPSDTPFAAELLSLLTSQTAIAIRNAAYTREVHFKAASLHAANAQLRTLDELKDRFLATVSHELRTPLNYITGFGTILLDGEDVAPLEEEQRYFVQKMLDGAFQLLGLVNDLLDYSSIRAGQLALTPEACDMVALLHDVMALAAPLAAQRELTLEARVPTVLPELTIDDDRVRQAVMNLLSNAIKFTPLRGRVVLTAHLTPTALRIEISDTGPGIQPQEQPRLFKRFSRLPNEATPGVIGTGLGLAISKSLVEAHSGTVGVISPAWPARDWGHGAGCVFWIELPLGEAQHACPVG